MATAIDAPANTRPAMADVDVYGLTHPGLVRKINNDHFLVASFHRSVRVHGTSIPGSLGESETPSRGFLLLVADGVGSLATAGEGSALALTTLTQHLLHETEICSALILMDQARAAEVLREAVLRSHAALLDLGKAEGSRPATTLTMFAAFWPRAFIVHVGDSRMYRYRDGELRCFTSDQTFEQLMLESGAIKPGSAEASRLKHVLWSAVGNDEVVPQVEPTDLTRRDVSLLCTDGLTKHVSEDEIREHLSSNASSESICRSLLDLVLARGGSDNVTIVVGKVRT
jgi:protein phosphatase